MRLPVIPLRGFVACLCAFALSVPVWAAPRDLPAFLPPFVHVEGGTFIQGSAETQYAATEKAHESTVSSFMIASTETTQALWKEVMGSNPSGFKGENRPVETVSWMDAIAFCNALSEKSGLEKVYTVQGSEVTWDRTANGFRLPTESEWEWAARGGPLAAGTGAALTKAPYSGSMKADEVVWYNLNSKKVSHDVAQKMANELGLYDMSGNVWEWCWDWYALYPSAAQTDYSGPEKAGAARVMRGGAWFTPANLTRVTYRTWSNVRQKANSIGFRLALNYDGADAFAVKLPDGSKLGFYDLLAHPSK